MNDFEQWQATWTQEKQEDMYTINQSALYQSIRAKKASAHHFSEMVEKVILSVNFLIGVGLLLLTLIKGKDSWASYSIIVIMLAMAGYVLYVRLQRLRASGTFDRSLTGDLDQAISDTRHRVRISKMGLLYIPVIALFSILAVWSEGKPLWLVGLIALFFVGAFLAGRWEHRNWHQGRLEALKDLRREMEQ
ncbi:MAG: hypothetical protein AAF840_18790 [Bacteroidota bacterium]